MVLQCNKPQNINGIATFGATVAVEPDEVAGADERVEKPVPQKELKNRHPGYKVHIRMDDRMKLVENYDVGNRTGYDRRRSALVLDRTIAR